jgi:hypothetical protein
MVIESPLPPDEKAKVLDHIKRASPPWARDHFTECGRNVNDVKAFLTVDEAVAKFKKLGRQRASFSTCMTCVDRANAHGGYVWEKYPIGVVQRYCERSRFYRGLSNYPEDPRTKEGERLDQELRAIAMLVERHRDEFDQALEDMGATSSFAEAQRAKRRQ